MGGSGRVPALVEEEAQGLLSLVCLLVWYHLASLTVLSLFCGLCDRPFFSFPGIGFIEMGKCITGGGIVIGDRGVAESAVSCSIPHKLVHQDRATFPLHIPYSPIGPVFCDGP